MVVYTNDKIVIMRANILKRIGFNEEVDVKIAEEFKQTDGTVYKIIIKRVRPSLVKAVDFLFK